MFLKTIELIKNWRNKSKKQQNLDKSCHKCRPKTVVVVGLVSIAITIALAETKKLGIWETLELSIYDSLIRFYTEKEEDSRILIVEIAESDIAQYKELPLRDQTIAQVIKNIQKHQPKVIGLDIYRDIPYQPGFISLKQQLQAENVIAINRLGGVERVPAPSYVPPERVGFNDFVIDRDNILRRQLLYAELNSQPLYSFALRISLSYLADMKLDFSVKPDALQIGETVFPALNADSGAYQMAQSEALGWQILLNYKNYKIPAKVRLSQVLREEIPAEYIKGKIVLIGTTAPSLKDLFLTPYSQGDPQEYQMPGIVVHAQMVSQILAAVLAGETPMSYLPEIAETLWLWFGSILAIILVWRSAFRQWSSPSRYLSGVLGLIYGIIIIGAIDFILFGLGIWVPIVPTVLGYTIMAILGLGYQIFKAQYYDALTGIPNRKLFIRQLKSSGLGKAKDDDEMTVVLYLDLDRFKLINDALGYGAGDILLQMTAQRLEKLILPPHMLARISDNKFAIGLQKIRDMRQAFVLAEELQTSLAEPFYLDDNPIYTTVSIGIAHSSQQVPVSCDSLLRKAEIAMYKVKATGKGNYKLFAENMQVQAVDRWYLEADLRQAINSLNQASASSEFELYYQPIIYFASGKIAGFEALIRWNSPQFGFVSPGKFIPLAEETGLIIPLGKWILETACQQVKLWQQQFPSYSDLMISINLSGRQFSQANLVADIADILNKIAIAPTQVKLEITESMVMQDVERAIEQMSQLKDLRLRLSMDDFGTGFSSFSYLHRFPIDTLKIDRSFVNLMEESQKNYDIVDTIIMLGKRLGIDLIAEGIETKGQMEALKDLNCDYGQGYFFAKPLNSQAAQELLSQNLIY